jgi:voltage-dependent calcium channel L type alpha-1D
MVIKNQSPALTHQIDEETKLDENNETIQSRVPFTEGKFTDIYSAANTHMNLDPDLEIVDDPYASLALEKSKAEELKKLLEDEEPSHLGDSKFLQMCYVIAKSQIFNFAFIFITLTNTVTLASYYKGMSQESTAVLDTMERIFRWLFFVEMLIKLLGLGFKKYVRDGFNILEALLVILSMVEEGFALANIELEAGAFTAFRAIRLLRIFRLARSWKTLHELVNMMEKSIKDVSTFSILLLIIMLIFLLLGSELFAHRIEFKTREQTEAVKFVNQTGDHEHSETPRTNFDTPALGFITIFLVIVGDDWNRIMYDFYRVLYTESPLEAYFATGYFMVLYIVGNIILLNLFLAILLANFDMNKEEDDDVEEDDIEN